MSKILQQRDLGPDRPAADLPRLALSDIIHRYQETKTRRWFEALRVRRLQVAQGEALAIIGPNGAGKSTLLEILAALLPPTEGSLHADGRDVWGRGRAATLAARRASPTLLQRTTLFSGSVLRNAMYGLRVRGIRRDEARDRAIQSLRLVGMEDLIYRRENELSGGQKRRVALAAVLALRPTTIILDEPTTGLDLAAREIVERTITTLNREHGVTIILATHDIRQADRLATRTVSVIAGRVLDGPVENIFEGQLEAVDVDHFEFRSLGAPLWRLPRSVFREDPWLGLTARPGPCTLAIPSDAFEVTKKGSGYFSPNGAVVQGIRLTQSGDYRLGTELNHRRLVVTVARQQVQHSGVKLGDEIGLSFRRGSVSAIAGE